MPRKLLALSAVLASGVFFCAAASAAEKSVNVKGEVVDLACYSAKGAHGESHRSCADACLKGGQPAGLLTASGELYVLVADHQDGKPFADVKQHAADTVEVKGVVSKKGALTTLSVQSVSVTK